MARVCLMTPFITKKEERGRRRGDGGISNRNSGALGIKQDETGLTAMSDTERPVSARGDFSMTACIMLVLCCVVVEYTCVSATIPAQAGEDMTP